jgi:hypothetical protein
MTPSNPNQSKYKPYPLNAPGPFYVDDGSCLSCMAPHQEAPELMGYDEKVGHCYFQRQPASKEEITHALRALWSSEVLCLRYAGNDSDILRRLANGGMSELCDQPVSPSAHYILRNHVTFDVSAATLFTLQECAHRFRDAFLKQGDRYTSYTATEIETHAESLVFACGWSSQLMEVRFSAGEAGTTRLLISHSPKPEPGSQSLSFTIDDWLNSDPRVSDIRWYSFESWHSTNPDWQDTPL